MDERHVVDRILEAARAILERGDLSQLTFRAVAREAEISVGTLAYYFVSRAELLEALLDPHHDAFAKRAAPVLGLEQGEIGVHLDEVRALVRFAFENQANVRLRLATWMQSWGLPPDRADASSALLAKATEKLQSSRWSREERLVALQLLVYGTQHFAALAPDELARVTTLTSEEDARALVEATIERIVVRVFSNSRD